MALQLAGAALVLLPFAALLTGRASLASSGFLFSNLAGAALLAVSAGRRASLGLCGRRVRLGSRGRCSSRQRARTRGSVAAPQPRSDALAAGSQRQRFHELGDEPDPRFSLANERTFLAWTRTALGLLVAGLAVVQFSRSLPHGVRLAIGLPLIAVAALIGFSAYSQWRAVELALRLDQPLPAPRLLAAPSFVVGAVALCTFVTVVVFR